MRPYTVPCGQNEGRIRVVVRFIDDVHEGRTLGRTVTGRSMTDATVLFEQSLALRHFGWRSRRDSTEYDLDLVDRHGRRLGLGLRRACRSENGEQEGGSNGP